MGQKVNPTSLRLGIIKTWNSVWYSEKKNYAKALHEDLAIRKYIKDFNFTGDKKNQAQHLKTSPEISAVQIFRKPDRVTVVINTSRPGVVIGADGKNIQEITKYISKITSLKVDVKIKEIKKPEIDAKLIAENVAKQLSARFPFRRIMKKVIQDAKKSGVGGIKIQCSGRLGGADMARTEWYRDGRIPLHTLRADIEYGTATAFTTYGTSGVKVWIFHKEVIKKDIKEDAGQLIKRPRRNSEK
ncbi:MAG: 30S ribosomal protein S3 [Spirochaetes bacterium]|nr:30S ribosomal protein S3 [Spirochaetota bacterium]